MVRAKELENRLHQSTHTHSHSLNFRQVTMLTQWPCDHVDPRKFKIRGKHQFQMAIHPWQFLFISKLRAVACPRFCLIIYHSWPQNCCDGCWWLSKTVCAHLSAFKELEVLCSKHFAVNNKAHQCPNLILICFNYCTQYIDHRRKFRSRTSRNMDRWKSRGGKSQRREEKKEDQRRERVSRKICGCA